MSSCVGTIMEIDHLKPHILFKSIGFCDTTAIVSAAITRGENIDPLAYNPQDSCLYFYSSNGVFKGRLGTDLSQIEKWQKVLNPKVLPMGKVEPECFWLNVRQLLFTPDNKLVFLTRSHGIGLFDGRTLRMIP